MFKKYDRLNESIEENVRGMRIVKGFSREEYEKKIMLDHSSDEISTEEARVLIEAVQEAFGTGTAAVVSPIGQLSYGDKNYIVNNFEIGETTQYLYDTLTSIQWGKAEDPYGWTVKI